MAVTMEMLSVISAPKPPGPVPDGMKVTALTDPATLNMAPACPALAVGAFTFWPMSYIDNRVSFGMVSYDPQGKVTQVVEVPGARYVYKITLDATAQTAVFWGQSDQHVSLKVDQIYNMLLE
jgi:hypothetical protein